MANLLGREKCSMTSGILIGLASVEPSQTTITGGMASTSLLPNPNVGLFGGSPASLRNGGFLGGRLKRSARAVQAQCNYLGV